MLSSLILSILLAASSTRSTPVTTPSVSTTVTEGGAAAARPLKGRFIHITDVHPDPYYRRGASEDEACHFKEKKKKKGKGKKGKGKAVSGQEWSVESEADFESEGGADASLKPDGARDAGYWGLPVRYIFARAECLASPFASNTQPHVVSCLQRLRHATFARQRHIRLAGKALQGRGGLCRLDGR